MSGTSAKLSADGVIQLLGLEPHPEGGHFVETFRDAVADGARAAGSAIYYLLRAGEQSAWHRVQDAAEVWHGYSGAPLSISIAPPEHPAEALRLGPDLQAGEQPQIIVPAGYWQSATSLGHWTLVGCTVSPAFEFGSFEMAPEGWAPPQK